MAEHTELLPCPFCGGVDIEIETRTRSGIRNETAVELGHWCADYPGDVKMGVQFRGQDEPSVIAAWNTRAALTKAGEAE